jgi:peptidoglycan/xylan/chitin deacetylase (PgdA/CDA1 family)
MMHDVFYKSILGIAGLFTGTMRIYRPTIFCFHSVTSADDPATEKGSMSIDSDFFNLLASKLRDLDIPVIRLEEAVARLRARELAPFVVLTFDDGYRDIYTNFLPIALRHRLPFTVFITTGLIDGEVSMWWELVERCRRIGALSREREARLLRFSGLGESGRIEDALRAASPARQRAMVESLQRLAPELPDPFQLALSWDMLREMASSGLLTVGAHSAHHTMLSSLSPEAILGELRICRRRIKEEMDIDVSLLAYPFGQRFEVGPIARAMARVQGFDEAFSTEARPLTVADLQRRFWLPRILLARKAQHVNIAMAYMSGLPAALNRSLGRSHSA